MPRALRSILSAAIGPRGAGISVEVRARNPTSDEMVVASWGELRGPAVIEEVFVRPDLLPNDAYRIIPMAFAMPVQFAGAGPVDRFVSLGIPVLRGVDGSSSSVGVRAIMRNRSSGRFWPRLVIPWSLWVPGAIWFESLGISANELVVDFSIRYLWGG